MRLTSDNGDGGDRGFDTGEASSAVSDQDTPSKSPIKIFRERKEVVSITAWICNVASDKRGEINFRVS